MNRDQLHAHFDGELPPADRAEVERALQKDPALAADLRAIAAVDRALEALPGLEAPPDLETRVRRALRARTRGRLLALALPLAAAAAALALFLLPRRPEPAAPAELFTAEDYRDYAWEADAATYGSLALRDLKAEILSELSG
jgi:anti-sigma factor RsiW